MRRYENEHQRRALESEAMQFGRDYHAILEQWEQERMPRIHYNRERRDMVFYDTVRVEENTPMIHMFGNANVGAQWLTNLQIAGQLGGPDGTFLIQGFAMRLIGTSSEEEEVLLDHFLIHPQMGGRPLMQLTGSMLSTKRFIQEELKDQEKEAIHPPEAPREPETSRRMGYQLAKPILVPVRQNFQVLLEFRREILGVRVSIDVPLVARVMVFGIQSRIIQ
jgi:hypothetical protein